MRRTDIKYQADDGLRRLETVGTDRPKLDDEVTVLNITSDTFKTVYKVGIEQVRET